MNFLDGADGSGDLDRERRVVLHNGGGMSWQLCSQMVTIPAGVIFSLLREHAPDWDKGMSAVYQWLLVNTVHAIQGDFGGIA